MTEVQELGAIPLLLGYVSTICFTSQYFPQTILNFRRRSVEGFSTVGILIKLAGASFFMVNCYLQEEALPTTIYGVFNVLQHSVFMFQFAYYMKEYYYIAFCLFPLIPFFLGFFFPFTLSWTSSMKPLSQLLSHFPQLYVTYKKKSSSGVSLYTQHLNIVGGFCGLYMYMIIPPKSWLTYFVYINSIFQAVSLYSLVVYFDGWKELLRNEFSNEVEKKHKIIKLNLDTKESDKEDSNDGMKV